MTMVKLGSLICPSGRLLILDLGLSGWWKHQDDPSSLDPAPGSDLHVVGRDAQKAGQAFDLQTHPRYFLDIPDPRGLAKEFAAFCKSRGFQARAEVLPKRVTHWQRAQHNLQLKPASIVMFVGLYAAVLEGLPRHRPLQVLGHRMPPGQEQSGRWQRVVVEVEAGETVSSEVVRSVAAPNGQMLFADLEAMGSLQASHVHTLQEEITETPRRCSSVELEGNPVVAFETSWGAGYFPIVVEYGAQKQLLRFWVDMIHEEFRMRARRQSQEALITHKIYQGHKIRYGERLEPAHDSDSGWMFCSGEESDAEFEDLTQYVVVPLFDVLDKLPSMRDFVSHPVGTLLRLKGKRMVLDE